MILNQVKTQLGIAVLDTSKDDLLKQLITFCSDDATSFCNLSEYDDKLERIVVQMVVVRYNLLGTEGVAQQSFSGVSETFVDGYPLDILKSLRKYRRVVMV